MVVGMLTAYCGTDRGHIATGCAELTLDIRYKGTSYNFRGTEPVSSGVRKINFQVIQKILLSASQNPRQ
jgi:hypothetical protein